MNSQILNLNVVAILKYVIDQLNTFDQIIKQLQVQINELSSQISISMLTRLNISINLKEIASITVTTTKFEKLSDSLMFNKDQKELYFFVTKFCLKFFENADQFLINRNKI